MGGAVEQSGRGSDVKCRPIPWLGGFLSTLALCSCWEPGPLFVQKAFLMTLFWVGVGFRRGLLLEGILRFKMGWT